MRGDIFKHPPTRGAGGPAAAHRQRRAAQVVGQQVVDRAVLPHRHPLAARVVVLADGAPRLLVVVANVDRGGAVDRGLHPVAVAVIGEGGVAEGIVEAQGGVSALANAPYQLIHHYCLL